MKSALRWMTTGRFLCFIVEKKQKNFKKRVKARSRAHKKHSKGLQFTNNE